MNHDTASCYSISEPKARKQHQCCECRGVIEKGEDYQIFSGIWDGKASTYKTCVDCLKLRADYIKEAELSDDEAPAFGYLRSDLMEDPYNNDLLNRMDAIMAKRHAPAPPAAPSSPETGR